MRNLNFGKAMQGNRTVLQFKLSDLPAPFRLAIFFFCLYCIFGPFVSLAYHVSKVGVGFEAMQKHYFGVPEEYVPPKGPAFFFEVMHFHTWSQAVVLFVLASLFSFSSFKFKTPVILALFLSSLGHIFLPSATRFLSKAFIYPLFVSTVLLNSIVIFMSLWILYDVFWKVRR